MTELCHEKTNNVVFNRTDTKLAVQVQKMTRWLKVGNFRFRKYRNCTIRDAKAYALISFAVTAELICVFVFPYPKCWFSYDAANFFFI